MATKGSTVDATDVAKFARLGETWWDESGPMAQLHRLNPVRLRFLRDHMIAHFPHQDATLREAREGFPLTGLHVLDIGCGGGILSEPLARLGASVTGVDPAAENIAVARTHAEEGGIAVDYRATTAEALAAAGESFDIVMAMEVVEHVTDVRAFLATACAMVKPGGLFFAATLNRTFKSFALAIVGAEYILRWVPKGTHQWEKFVTPRELEDALALCGVTIFDQTGVILDPFTRAWRTGRDMDVNYMAVGKKADQGPSDHRRSP
jgi:2-polyprenyl-6-hydroxyphenyl methylase/3-demethylubiquinone-9 3-methyltransferase